MALRHWSLPAAGLEGAPLPPAPTICKASPGPTGRGEPPQGPEPPTAGAERQIWDIGAVIQSVPWLVQGLGAQQCSLWRTFLLPRGRRSGSRTRRRKAGMRVAGEKRVRKGWKVWKVWWSHAGPRGGQGGRVDTKAWWQGGKGTCKGLRQVGSWCCEDKHVHDGVQCTQRQQAGECVCTHM